MIRYKEYVIKANAEGGYILGKNLKVVVDQNGKENESITYICYPATLKGCLNKIVSLELAKVIDNNVLDLRQTIIELDNITTHLENTLKGLIKEEF